MAEPALVSPAIPRPVVRVSGFSKRYRDTVAVERCDLEIQAGQIYGLIGPDGSGKSSLMKAIAGVLSYEAGRIDVFGVTIDSERSAERIKGRLGLMPQGLGLNLAPDLSVEENIDYFAAVRLVSPADLVRRKAQLLAMTRLDAFRDRPMRNLSGGMKQKLGLVCTLIHEPELIVLDEPTTGVDPVSRRDFWTILAELVREHGITALISTAYMDEAARFNQVSLMYRGRVLAQGTPDEIQALAPGTLVALRTERQMEAADRLRARYTQVEAQGSWLRVFSEQRQPALALAEIEALLAGFDLAETKTTEPEPEDVFVALLQQQGLMTTRSPASATPEFKGRGATTTQGETNRAPTAALPEASPALTAALDEPGRARTTTWDEASRARTAAQGAASHAPTAPSSGRGAARQDQSSSLFESGDNSGRWGAERFTMPAAEEPAIEARGLIRDFGSFRAVDRVSFQVRQGEIFGLLGANGAGKTTVIKMLTGILPLSGGEGRVAGADMRRAGRALKSRIGYMSQAFSLYRDLTVSQNIHLYAGIYGLSRSAAKERVAWIVGMAGLAGHQDDRADSLPMGVRQRLALGCALVHRPRILFLDEPTSGVDPVGRRQFWDLLFRLSREDGVAILVSTHVMTEAERCDHLVLMFDGRVIADASPAAMERSVEEEAGRLLDLQVERPGFGLPLLMQNGFPDAALYGSHLHVLSRDPESDIPHLRELLASAGIDLKAVTRLPLTMEDVFVYRVTALERAGRREKASAA